VIAASLPVVGVLCAMAIVSSWTPRRARQRGHDVSRH
jgi:hypothetical protein